MHEYARYFKNQLLSDCDLVISWPADGAESSSAASEQQVPNSTRGNTQNACNSISFPSHQLLLFRSRQFEAQVQRWQKTVASSTTTHQQQTSDHTSERPKITLSIDSKEQLPVAEAVIAALYGIEQRLATLQHDQLMQALVLADMVDLQQVTEQAIMVVKSIYNSHEKLSAAAIKYLSSRSAWPECMHPLLPSLVTQSLGDMASKCCDLEAVIAADNDAFVQRLMLAFFSDLQAVWEDSALSKTLMQMPLPAIQLLLSSDQLQVPSEDFVLYTAQQYKTQQPEYTVADTLKVKEMAKSLSSLVRAPLLSDFALQHAALAVGESSHVMFQHQEQLRLLMTLKRLRAGGCLESELKEISQAPKSWLLKPRHKTDECRDPVVWRLPMKQLAKTCKQAAKNGNIERIDCPDTYLMGGLAWRLRICCDGKEKVGTTAGVYVGPCTEVTGMFYKFQCNVVCDELERDKMTTSECMRGCECYGWPNYFGIGLMAGGWDCAAWAAKGLTEKCDLVLKLWMHKVW